jgi:hypothetical protein
VAGVIRRLCAAAALVLLAASAQAQWRVVPPQDHDAYISTTAKAFTVGSSGYHALGVTCRDGGAILYTLGYPASPGAAAATIDLIVDGRSLRLPGQLFRTDGFWVGALTPEVLATLQGGAVATLVLPGHPPIAYALQGAAAAMAQALAACPAATARPTGPALPPEFVQTLTQICRGAFEVDPRAYVVGDVDGDGVGDRMLDFAGLSCADPSIGRGGGSCGINQCTIWVQSSRSGITQVFLGLGPTAVVLGSGQAALKITNLRPSCPGGAMSCETFRVWNGTELAVIR